MSLQVWLPLNGNLFNKGCSSLTFSALTTNTVTNTSGKIGSCYGNNSYTAGGVCSDTTISLGQKQSMFCWFKFTSLLNSGLGGALVSQHRHATNSGMGITIRRVSDSTGYLSVNTGNGSSRTYNTYYGTTLLQANAWYHGGYTYDGSTIRIYVNGVCEKEQAYTGMSVPADYITAFCWSFNASTGSAVYGNYKLNGYLNDVRVYDHCLSLAEIKELAKGLVCHYKLDEFYSADNLIINGFGELGTENWNNGSYISTTEIPPNHPEIKASMHSGNMTKQYIPIIQNHTYTISGYIKAMSGTTGNTYPSIYGYDIDKKFIDYYKCTAGFNSTYRTTLAQPLHKGDTVIYATDLSAWTTGDNHFYHVAIFGYQNSLGEVYPDMVYTQDSPVFGTKTDKSHINKTNNTITLNAAFTGEDRPAGTTICQATEGSVYLYPWGGIAVSAISDWVFKTANFKPSTSSRLNAAAYIRWSTYGRCYIAGNKLVDIVASDDTIIDSSGYGYHGTKTGTISPSIDTPRYSLSTNFPENSSTVTITPYLTNNQTLTEISVSCWYKTNTLNSTAPNLWSLGENSFLRLRLASTTSIWYYARVGSTQTGYTYTAGKTLTDNAWHHVVLTFKNGVFVVYVDGSQIGTSDASGTATYLTCANTAWHLAGYTANSENFIGNLSDFRIYTTCLSADDVLRLYNTAASVAKNGAMLGYEMKEEL